MESKGYICPLCKTIFSSLDVSRLLNVRTGSFDCDICPDSELQAYDPMISNSGGTKSASGPHELHSRLMEQTRLIVELLKKADDITIPAFNSALWLEQNAAKYSLLATELGKEDESGPQLAIAGANSSETQISVSVELADEDSVKAASSSVSNPLPEWHMYSTITGEAIRSSGQAESNTEEQIKAVSEVVDISDDQDDIANYYSQIAADEDDSTSKLSKQVKLTPEMVSSIITVMVAGKAIPLDQVTEDDKDKMTEEEYTQYYEIYMSNQ
jgi:transcription initiation factor TFIIE subunit alpha